MKNNLHSFKLGPNSEVTENSFAINFELNGEEILSATPEIGYTSRGIEKIVQNKNTIQALSYINKINFLTPLSNELAFVLGVERIMGIKVNKSIKFIRVIFTEFERIFLQVMFLGKISKIVGIDSLYYNSLALREDFLNFWESVFKERFLRHMFIPGEIKHEIKDKDFSLMYEIFIHVNSFVVDVKRMLIHSQIFKERACGIGLISAREAVSWGLSGPNLRSTGILHDVRAINKYDAYEYINFKIISLNNGDVYARTLLRAEEILESINIIEFCISELRNENNKEENQKENKIDNFEKKQSIKQSYSQVESPSGAFGMFIELDDNYCVKIIKISPPSLHTIAILEHMLVSCLISDIPLIVASLDIMIGEVDR